MAQLLQTLSIIAFAVAGVLLVLAIFFWFFFKIPTVIGDLTGRTARKSIAKMRSANEKTGIKTYHSSKTNASRGKLTETMPDAHKKQDEDGSAETVLLKHNPVGDPEGVVTGVLNEARSLQSQATGLLIDENETAPLDAPPYQMPVRPGGKKLTMIKEVMLIHTNEVIR